MPALEIAQVAPQLAEVAAGVAAHAERVTLLDRGTPVAVLVATHDLRGLIETVELLSDPDGMRRIREGEDDFASGAVVAGSDLGMLDPEHRYARPARPRPAAAAAGPDVRWELAVSGHARRSIEHLPPHVGQVVIRFLFERLVADPQRVGVEMRGGLKRRLVARVETEKVVYRLDTVKRAVRVLEILHGGGLVGHHVEAVQGW